MEQKTIRVRAVGRAKLLAHDGRGYFIPGRYVGRDRRGEILAEGELVPANSYHTRAVRRGDLELVTDHVARIERTAADLVAPAKEI